MSPDGHVSGWEWNVQHSSLQDGLHFGPRAPTWTWAPYGTELTSLARAATLPCRNCETQQFAHLYHSPYRSLLETLLGLGKNDQMRHLAKDSDPEPQLAPTSDLGYLDIKLK